MSAVRRISAPEAQTLLAQGHAFVDVRTEEEYAAGHPHGALNVPFLVSVEGVLTPNSEFLEVMNRVFAKEAALVLGCAAGNRSAKAAALLLADGFCDLSDLRPGWNGARDAFGQLIEKGWLACGLPTELTTPGGAYPDVKRRP
jgi:rhodanese-related sulfurtransferase